MGEVISQEVLAGLHGLPVSSGCPKATKLLLTAPLLNQEVRDVQWVFGVDLERSSRAHSSISTQGYHLLFLHDGPLHLFLGPRSKLVQGLHTSCRMLTAHLNTHLSVGQEPLFLT